MSLPRDNVIQAVVIMDPFNNNFSPITSTKPLGLLKVAGVPLIDFTIDSLAQGGVKEIFLFCCTEGKLIQEHIQKAQENKIPWTYITKVEVIISECRTMGDVMREIETAGFIKGHFILTSVNTISNVPFASYFEKHKIICEKDERAVMSLIYMKIHPKNPLFAADKPVFLATDEDTDKILMFKKCKKNDKEKYLYLPKDMLLGYPKIFLRYNLTDANIAICSPSVLHHFTGNFHFQTREDFINGMLGNEEILNGTLYYLHLNKYTYAAAVTNWKTYQIISQDILYNLIPTLSVTTGSLHQNVFYTDNKYNVRSKTAKLGKSCTLVNGVLIGEYSDIGDNTFLSKTIIGKNCKIGNDVSIVGSQIMDNVIIQSNSKITNSFIDDNCVVEENSVLKGGTILAAGITVPAGTQMNGSVIENSVSSEEMENSKNISESGAEWDNISSGSEDDEHVGYDMDALSESDSYYTDESSETSLCNSPILDDTNLFLQEVVESLARGYEQKLECDNLILEINSSRFAYNIELQDANSLVIKALLSLPVLCESENVAVTVKDIFVYFQPILGNYIKSESSIMDCLRGVEESCVTYECLQNKAGLIVNTLYQADIVDEDSLLTWKDDLEKNQSPILNQTSLQKFFEWLEVASEESE